jgi:hypothetical protein
VVPALALAVPAVALAFPTLASAAAAAPLAQSDPETTATVPDVPLAYRLSSVSRDLQWAGAIPKQDKLDENRRRSRARREQFMDHAKARRNLMDLIVAESRKWLPTDVADRLDRCTKLCSMCDYMGHLRSLTREAAAIEALPEGEARAARFRQICREVLEPWERSMVPATAELAFERISEQVAESLAAHLELIRFEAAHCGKSPK